MNKSSFVGLFQRETKSSSLIRCIIHGNSICQRTEEYFYVAPQCPSSSQFSNAFDTDPSARACHDVQTYHVPESMYVLTNTLNFDVHVEMVTELEATLVFILLYLLTPYYPNIILPKHEFQTETVVILL